MIEITDKSKCCGCSACSQKCPKNCIEMKKDKEGFLYPVVNKDVCIDCGMCEKVCPVLRSEPEKKFTQTAYLVQNKNQEILGQSTSGGAFTAIAENIIERGGVVFGAAFDDDFNVFHTYAENANDLRKFRNSKYVQSDIRGAYKDVLRFLKEGRAVLFSGTPCQAEGLYRYLGKKYDNLIIIDTVCRAVPSPELWKRYLDYRKKDSSEKPVYAAFRDKYRYGYQYSQMHIKFDSGRDYYSGVESDPYLRAFFNNLCDRPSCHECAFKKRYRISDITVWDCFNVSLIDKAMDNNRGVTRMLVHSEAGEKLVSTLKNVQLVAIDPDVAVNRSKELVKPTEKNQRRDEFFSDFESMEMEQLIKKWFPHRMKVKLERFTRKFLARTGLYRIAKKTARKVVGKD